MFKALSSHPKKRLVDIPEESSGELMTGFAQSTLVLPCRMRNGFRPVFVDAL